MAADLLYDNILYEWDESKLVEIILSKPDDFLKIKETLTRIGLGNQSTKTLTQSCHILHRRGKYYICHFKELIALEGSEAQITLTDVARRNTIVSMLKNWNLLSVPDESRITNQLPTSMVFVLPHEQKGEWTLKHKHRLGAKRNEQK